MSSHGLRTKNKNGSTSRFNTELVTDFDTTLDKVEVIPQDLGRVLLNLFNNAFYAVRQKQEKGLEGYQPKVSMRTRRQEGQVEIRVQDNGMGIPQAVLDKIFQPFFTTKPSGEGTGLGLSLSYDIITKGTRGRYWWKVRKETAQRLLFSYPICEVVACVHYRPRTPS